MLEQTELIEPLSEPNKNQIKLAQIVIVITNNMQTTTLKTHYNTHRLTDYLEFISELQNLCKLYDEIFLIRF